LIGDGDDDGAGFEVDDDNDDDEGGMILVLLVCCWFFSIAKRVLESITLCRFALAGNTSSCDSI